MSIPQSLLEQSIQINVQQALQEDIGEGDITALLTPEHEQATATIISRDDMVLAQSFHLYLVNFVIEILLPRNSHLIPMACFLICDYKLELCHSERSVAK